MTQPSTKPMGLVFLVTAAHLAALGILGSPIAVCVILLSLLSFALVPVGGVGLVLWAILLPCWVGLAKLETIRVQDLYSFPRTSRRILAPAPAGSRAKIGWLLRQSVAPSMWRPLGCFLAAAGLGLTMLGAVVVGLQLVGHGVLSPFDKDPISRFFLVLAGVALWGLTPLCVFTHIWIARALVSSPSREELAIAAQASSIQRESAVQAASLERFRLERDLHDGIQPRLVSIGMTLGLAQHKIDSDPHGARELVAEAHTSTKAAITELRQLARGIHASILTDRGLDAALSALAARTHIPVELDVRLGDRNDSEESRHQEAEAAAYFVVAEGLTNAAKHAEASRCRVLVRHRDPETPESRLWARIEDDGGGGAQFQPGGGLEGIRQRVSAAGGMMHLDSPAGGPTVMEVNIPCVS